MNDSRQKVRRNERRNWHYGKHDNYCIGCESCTGISILQNPHTFRSNCPVIVNDASVKLLWRTSIGWSYSVTVASKSFHNYGILWVCMSYKTHWQNWMCISQCFIGTHSLVTWYILVGPCLRNWGWRTVASLEPDWAACASKASKVFLERSRLTRKEKAKKERGGWGREWERKEGWRQPERQE